MADHRVLDLTRGYWCTLKLHTATDQCLAINQTTGALASFRKKNPNEGEDAKWFKFLVVPRNVKRNEYWIFSQAAQHGAGELVARWRGNELGQWGFEDLAHDQKNWQVFQIEPLDTFDETGKVVIRIVEDDRAISTRWDAAAFLWEYEGDDDQQWLHIARAGACWIPDVPEIEGEPGQLDRDKLEVGGFHQDAANGGVVRETKPRVVGAQIVSFPRVKDTYSMGRKMKETPYYLLTHTCFWRLVKDQEYDGAGSVDETLKWKVGTSTSKEVSIESHLDITVGAKTTYEFPTGGGGEVSFAAEFGHRWKSVSKAERYEEKEGEEHVRYERGDHVRVVVWALVNRYVLERQNREQIGAMEFVERDEKVRRSHVEPASLD